MVIENSTILEEWKQNWREGGFGALRLFGVEHEMQASNSIMGVNYIENISMFFLIEELISNQFVTNRIVKHLQL